MGFSNQPSQMKRLYDEQPYMHNGRLPGLVRNLARRLSLLSMEKMALKMKKDLGMEVLSEKEEKLLKDVATAENFQNFVNGQKAMGITEDALSFLNTSLAAFIDACKALSKEIEKENSSSDEDELLDVE